VQGPIWFRRAARDEGYTRFCAAGEDLRHLGFGVARLAAGQEWELQTQGEELLAVVLTGRVDARAGSGRWDGLGGRASVFAGRATAIYAPPGARLWVRAVDGAAALALCQSPVAAGQETPAPYVIRPEDVRVSVRGRAPFLREVHDILDETRPAARLVVGETVNAPGNWSSYPPHKHDTARGEQEACLEELYFFQLDPPQGFAAQFLYTSDGTVDEVHRVRHGDVMLIPRGYHPVAAAPGYRLYYLWVMAGEGRRLRPFDEPDHAWVKQAPA
jgi:5-deoxy-glucuronate isomerase